MKLEHHNYSYFTSSKQGITSALFLTSKISRRNKINRVSVIAQILADFSHANSQKQFKRQIDVCNTVSAQVAEQDSNVFGVMIESHLKEGNQKLVEGVEPEYGKSITDACLGWDDTEQVLATLADAVKSKQA